MLCTILLKKAFCLTFVFGLDPMFYFGLPVGQIFQYFFLSAQSQSQVQWSKQVKLKGSKEQYLLGQHNMQIVGVIPFIKLQNNT